MQDSKNSKQPGNGKKRENITELLSNHDITSATKGKKKTRQEVDTGLLSGTEKAESVRRPRWTWLSF